MRWVVFVSICVPVAVCAFVAWTGLTGTHSAPSPVDLAIESEETVPAPRIFADGIVEGTHREISLRFEVPGRIKVVHVREGDAVAGGDVLAELETDIAALRLVEARTRLKIAIAERDQLVAESIRLARESAREKLSAAEKQVRDGELLAERGQSLARQEAISAKELDQMRQKRRRAVVQVQSLRSQVDSPESQLSREEEIVAEGKIALAEAAVRRERLLLDKVRLRAPNDGIVLRAAPEPGEFTGPTDDRELFTIVDRGATRVRAFVEELDALRVAPGQRAVVCSASNPNQAYPGTIRMCSLYVRPKSHQHLKPGERLDVRVREVIIELDNGADLLIGLPVEVSIDR
jgi:multidrug resistance efflux pump